LTSTRVLVFFCAVLVLLMIAKVCNGF
jgi:hypothetical protein